MRKTSTLSTGIDARIKDAVNDFCRQRRLNRRVFVEQALIEYLEDALDLATYQDRRTEETFALEAILKELRA